MLTKEEKKEFRYELTQLLIKGDSDKNYFDRLVYAIQILGEYLAADFDDIFDEKNEKTS